MYVQVPTLGQVRSVYRCPDCEGTFLEISAMSELTACPKCGDDQFAIDPTAVRAILD
jgi:putative FmdB family regulatory protein